MKWKRLILCILICCCLVQVPALYPVAHAENLSVGNTVFFGQYEQNNNLTDGKERIEWIVLDVQKDKVWLLSKYALDCQPYNTTNRSVAWETCTLRTWLNDAFIKEAFTEDEITAIVSSQVDNRKSQGFYTNTVGPFDFTYDKVYLLSHWEAWNYFRGDSARRCPPTQYAISKGAEVSSYDTPFGKKSGSWWLRSQGSDPRDSICVDTDGSRAPCYVDCNVVAVRPTIWIDLKAYDFSTGTVIKTQKLSKETAKIGSSVFYGSYEQDNVSSNGSEPIEWIVLDIKNNAALLLSKYVLDVQPYNTEDTDVSWETCSLRAWLNNDFFNSFTLDEQTAILTTDIDNSPYQAKYQEEETMVGGVVYKRNFGDNTKDKIFALSYTELMKYLNNLDERACYATEYSINRGVGTTPAKRAAWWLRSPGGWISGYPNTATYVMAGYDGSITVNCADCGVRPAIWVDLSLLQ